MRGRSRASELGRANVPPRLAESFCRENDPVSDGTDAVAWKVVMNLNRLS